MAEKERKKRVRKEVFQAAAEQGAPESETVSTAPAAASAKPQTAGDILRQAREEKGLSLQSVSSSIHLRTSQIRAIEEGQMSQLPGMTYAVGFVRSYAKFLKLDSEDIVARFKQENGAAGAAKPELHFPSPLTEGKTPGPMIIGVSTVFVVALLVLWAIFSGGGSDADEAGAETAAIEAPVDAPLLDAAQPVDLGQADAAAPTAVDDTTADGTAVTPAPAVAADATQADAAPVQSPAVVPVAPAVAAAPQAAAPVAPAPATGVTAPTETPVVVAPVTTQAAPAPVVLKPVESATAPAAPATAVEPIVVKQPKGRVVLQATETSWVQITDAKGNIILKKVLKPGERFSPPDQPGLSLVTSNAGGVALTVDGAAVNPLGGSGDIVRGVSLDPQSLKNRKVSRVRNY